MSMVGYILGLGDRHPSNLMLDRLSGKILHIDFGDCFEVAMTREKFPEKIPFRLTRMLVNAMEVSPTTCHFVTYSSNLSICGVAGDRNWRHLSQYVRVRHGRAPRQQGQSDGRFGSLRLRSSPELAIGEDPFPFFSLSGSHFDLFVRSGGR